MPPLGRSLPPFSSATRVRGLAALAAATALVVTTATAHAQDTEADATATDVADWDPEPRQFGFDIALTGGYQITVIDDGAGGESSLGQPIAGGRLTVNFNRWLAAEGEVDTTILNDANAEVDNSALEARGLALITLLPTWKVRPFIAVGYGVRITSGDEMAGTEDENRGRLVAGAGAKLMFSDRIGLRADALAFVPVDTASALVSGGEDGGSPDYALLGSLFFSIGEVKPERRLMRERVMVKPSGKDSDGDGLPDTKDSCPNEPEDMDGFGDDDGCPEQDNDRDGFNDAEDSCPNQAETRNGVEDDDGCPEDDSDADGYIGAADLCPEAPETANDFEDDDGCPDEVPEEIEKFTGVIDGVNFQSGSANLLRGSFAVLDRAVRVLERHPSLKLEIRGHTDSRGNPRRNLRLSENRAEAVRSYLISKGVDGSRLEAIGVGDDEPIADNNTRSGRARNRRTEFRLIGDQSDGDDGFDDAAPVAPVDDSSDF